MSGEHDIVAEEIECDDEVVEAPGHVQPHGILLAAREDTRVVVQASESTLALTGVEARALLGQPLERLFDPTSWAHLARLLALGRSGCPLDVRFAGLSFQLMLHRIDGLIVLELEPGEFSHATDEVVSLKGTIDRLHSARNLPELFRSIVTELKDLFGYHRVLLYRFHEDGHGEVMAEARESFVPSYLGHHYPASDIPPRARALYLARPLRIIQDAAARPSPIVPRENPTTGRSLDLSSVWLRSVSPIHVVYLHNMGVRGSLSVSLVASGKLFGLVACHHVEPKSLSYGQRVIGELLGRLLSFEIELIARNDEQEQALAAQMATSRFVERVVASGDGTSALSTHVEALLGLVRASGVAVVEEGRATLAGQTPGAADVLAIADWLRQTMKDPIFVTDELSASWPRARSLAPVASGLLATSFLKSADLLAMWFRPEFERTVTWAGDPRKALGRHPKTLKLEPRASFEEWRQTVRGRSMPWSRWEIDAAERVRSAMTGIVLRRAAELMRLVDEIRGALGARDEFIAMASHELRTPIATVMLSIEGILRSLSRDAPSISSSHLVSRLEAALRQIQRAATLVDQLLDVSRITSGSLVLERSDVDLLALARRVAARLEVQAEAVGSAIMVRGPVSVLGCWDEARLDQVVTNLVSNAIKYGAGRPVEIEVSRTDHDACLVVRDYGIGIPAEAQERIFERFERAVSANNYGGFGLGLWIVRKLVSEMGGQVTVASEEGRGATFTVILPCTPCSP